MFSAPKTIKLRTIKARGGCDEGRRLFEETFGKSAEVTVENAKKAFKAGLPVWNACYYSSRLSRRRRDADRKWFDIFAEAQRQLVEEGWYTSPEYYARVSRGW